MSEQMSISVNFGRPMPLFPLDTVRLLPQQVLPIHIFEPCYRKMVDDALDGSGQFAMAVFEGDQWKREYHGSPAIRPHVCIAQIAQHEKLTDGRYNLLVQGVCRARVVRELPPDDEVPYRRAVLEPVGTDDRTGEELGDTRERLRSMLSEGPLTHLSAASQIATLARDDELPTAALLELVSFTMVTDEESRYRLLAEPRADRRAALVERELAHLESLLRRAELQRPDLWPKGMSWN